MFLPQKTKQKDQKMTRKVFVVNKGAHDYSKAEQHGELVFISEGHLRPLGTGFMYRKLMQFLTKSNTSDLLLISGLPVMNVIAAGILGMIHGRLNLLLHRHGEYVVHEIKLGNLMEEDAMKDLERILNNDH